MNILFIAPYRQNDGWGLAAKDYAKALNTTSHNIAIRPIYMGSSIDKDLDEELLQLEQTSYDTYDLVIQKVLPHLFEKRDIPSLGLFTLETGNFKYNAWFEHAKLMDGILVPSLYEKNTLDASGINVPTWNVSEPVALQPEEGYLPGVPSDTFNFYFVGEFIKRKNLEALVRAFHSEFERSEPVNLVIKTNKSGLDNSALHKHVAEYINNIKREMRLYQNPYLYKSELLITTRLSEEELRQLHRSCNCFVMPSYGEALCRPAVEAMYYGNPVIATDNTGMTDFVDENTGWVVPSRISPVSSPDAPLPFIYTGHETWSEIDVLELRSAMRKAYQSTPATMAHMCSHVAKTDFTYQAVGQKIERAINEFTSI